MATKTTYTYTIILSLVIVFASVVRAEKLHWESYTSFRQSQEMVSYNGDIWTATTGGLIRVDPDTKQFKTYTNIDGLGTNHLLSLTVDDHNRLWVGGRGRLINFTDPLKPDLYLLTDRDGMLIDIVDIAATAGGDSLWLAAGRLGVVLFLPGSGRGEGLILDNFSRLGGIDRETPALGIALDSSNVWVATEAGFAVGSRADIKLLKSPEWWTSYVPTSIIAIPNDQILAIGIINDTVYIGTTVGPYRFDPNTIDLISLGFFGDPHVYHMTSFSDSLFIYTGRGTALLTGGVRTGFTTVGQPITNTHAGLIDKNGLYWSGSLADGPFYLEGNMMIPLDVGGSPSNSCLELLVAGTKVWGAFGSVGLSFLENDHWTKIDTIKAWVNTLALGPRGEIWAGTWGDGAWRIDGDSYRNFDSINSELSGPSTAPRFEIVADIVSSGDAIWFGTVFGHKGELVAVNPYDLTQWTAYRLSGGTAFEWVEALQVGQGVVYTGTRDNGIIARQYNGTPQNAADDYYIMEFNSSNSGIGSNIIKSMKIDGYDSLWVGTTFGLSFQSLGEIFFYNEALPDSFGPEITALNVDAQGSLYAGSARGLLIRDIATGQMTHLTSTNSGLVDDVINDIFFDESSNELWIATEGGISRLSFPTSQASAEIDNVLAYPNPFVIRFGGEKVRFNYAGLSQISIFTLAGELVRQLPVTGEWDGRNDFGEEVASGVYLFVLTGLEGETGRGKIFLVRE